MSESPILLKAEGGLTESDSEDGSGGNKPDDGDGNGDEDDNAVCLFPVCIVIKQYVCYAFNSIKSRLGFGRTNLLSYVYQTHLNFKTYQSENFKFDENG